jgi:hypothetical protein
MTEEEWLTCTDPQKMLGFLRDRASDRKFRLFASVCCRRVWPHIRSQAGHRLVEIAERYVDGLASKPSLLAADKEAFEAFEGLYSKEGYGLERIVRRNMPLRIRAAYSACWLSVGDAWEAAQGMVWLFGQKVRRSQSDLLRDIFGNPFSPVSIDPDWRTPTVQALATAAYEERILPAGHLEPDRLSILADALEEAGCTDTQILSHLRGPSGPHVRGCWVVDAILGKE